MIDNEYIYLDHNATSQVHHEVAKIVYSSLLSSPSNASSIHFYGREARKLIEQAKKEICDNLKINQNNYHIIFTSSGTEANNWVMSGLGKYHKLVGATEHISIIGAVEENYEIVSVDNKGIINLVELEEKLAKHSLSIVSIMMANNETGIIQPLLPIKALTTKYNALLHSDLVQAIGKININFEALELDLFTISAHKIGGPVGVAALFIRKNIDIKPLLKGGGQNLGLRAGTENTALILGFAKAIKLASEGLDHYQSHCKQLRDYTEAQLTSICPELEIVGKNTERLPNTSYLIMPNVNNETQLIAMDLNKIAVSAGSACSSGKIAVSHVLTAMGYNPQQARSAIRVSTGVNNTQDQLNKFIGCWHEIYNKQKMVKL